MNQKEIAKLNRKTPKILFQIQELRSKLRNAQISKSESLDSNTAELITVQLATYFTEEEKEFAKGFVSVKSKKDKKSDKDNKPSKNDSDETEKPFVL